MRVATSSALESALSNLQRRQEGLTRAQEQLTSGKRVLKPSDDPAAAATAERALASAKRADAQMRALDASKNAMQLTENALGDAGELMQQARELLVSAGNGSYSDSERQTIAEAIRGLRKDLLAVANRSDGAGRYLFGGQGSNGPPMVDAPGGVAYAGTAGQTQAASGEASPLSVNGQATWLQAPDPTSPGSSLSLFDIMDQAVADLQTPGRTSAQVAQTVSTGIGQFDAVSDNLSGARARAGEALNRIDGIGQRLSQSKLDAQTDRSNAEDLDMMQAISDFQNRQTGYDAALKTYSMVQQMSLFQYLK
jgi:flagellar hook-associated protein 3 FlgL